VLSPAQVTACYRLRPANGLQPWWRRQHHIVGKRTTHSRSRQPRLTPSNPDLPLHLQPTRKTDRDGTDLLLIPHPFHSRSRATRTAADLGWPADRTFRIQPAQCLCHRHAPVTHTALSPVGHDLLRLSRDRGQPLTAGETTLDYAPRSELENMYAVIQTGGKQYGRRGGNPARGRS